MTMVLLCLIGQQTHLPEPIENLDERHQPNNADELKATVKETWAYHTTSAVPQTDTSMPRPN